MRLRIFSVLRTASRRAGSSSKTFFDGLIPFEHLEKSVTFEGDRGIPQVELRFKVSDADWLHPDVKRTLVDRYAHRINADGELIVNSRRTRSEQLNVADCIDKLRSTLFDCEHRPDHSSPVDDARVAAIHHAKRVLTDYKATG
ncbi:Peptidyl-tRNA hydrolase ICT1, mitochondrial [Toxocara canis]|uniref:Peptidyl-tRNA hydrolase ICT1, mitochondrial n=1 Tax=Toxocara canis TaxID=6265 RepID=A0A0B2VDQ7_TOXCA|nr:Peptidyl-tRNA hydrolase ICT1, mitochondrial [Toxocara canis]